MSLFLRRKVQARRKPTFRTVRTCGRFPPNDSVIIDGATFPLTLAELKYESGLGFSQYFRKQLAESLAHRATVPLRRVMAKKVKNRRKKKLPKVLTVQLQEQYGLFSTLCVSGCGFLRLAWHGYYGDSLVATLGWTTLGAATPVQLLTGAWAQSSGTLYP